VKLLLLKLLLWLRRRVFLIDGYAHGRPLCCESRGHRLRLRLSLRLRLRLKLYLVLLDYSHEALAHFLQLRFHIRLLRLDLRTLLLHAPQDVRVRLQVADGFVCLHLAVLGGVGQPCDILFQLLIFNIEMLILNPGLLIYLFQLSPPICLPPQLFLHRKQQLLTSLVPVFMPLVLKLHVSNRTLQLTRRLLILSHLPFHFLNFLLKLLV